MSTVFKYRIFCNTEGTNVYQWATDEPTKCPNNTNHSIKASSTTIIEEIQQNVVKIKEESVDTGGHFRSESVIIPTIAGNSTNYVDKVWKYPVSVYSVSFITNNSNMGDNLSICTGPDTRVGVITENVTTAMTTFKVSPIVMQYIAKGYNIKLSDGTNTDELGEVCSFDTVNNTITVDNASTHNYNYTTPTYVLMEPYFIKNFEIGPAWKYDIGMSKIGSAYVPAGTVIRCIYKNNSSDPKKFVGYIEYTY